MHQSRREFLGSLAGATLLASAPATLHAAETAARPEELAVMAYNLRYASATGANSWPARRPLMKALLAAHPADLIGTQEGVYPQVRDVAADLPTHDWIGLGRDGGSRGEFMAVFYRRERFEPLEFDHFWLSDTPDVIGSSTWGNTNRRMVTWVRFRDRRTGKEFHFWNTHLDHALQPAREKAAALIMERIAKVPPEMPLLLVGDFNAVAGANPAYDLLVGPDRLQDTWTLAKERRNEDFDTFNSFATAQRRSRRIDWVLGRGLADVRASEIVITRPEGPHPSDHFPVMAWLTLK